MSSPVLSNLVNTPPASSSSSSSSELASEASMSSLNSCEEELSFLIEQNDLSLSSSSPSSSSNIKNSKKSEEMNSSSSSSEISKNNRRSNRSLIDLAQGLSEQAWGTIGQLDYPLGSTSKREVMIDQLTSVLEYRLIDLVRHRAARREDEDAVPMTTTTTAAARAAQEDDDEDVLGSQVRSQLRAFVSRVGQLYRKISYHSLEHATHVTMSINKMLSMIKNKVELSQHDHQPPQSPPPQRRRRRSSYTRRSTIPSNHIHIIQPDHTGHHHHHHHHHHALSTTYGIAEDPLTKFAMLFSALVHDVDHLGITNKQLVSEQHNLSLRYNGKSVAEQNSLSIAFQIFMECEFADLRQAICPTAYEQLRFRRIVIDMLFSTDISSSERMDIGLRKWNKAFLEQSEQPIPITNNTNIINKNINNKNNGSSSSPLSKTPSRRHSICCGKRKSYDHQEFYPSSETTTSSSSSSEAAVIVALQKNSALEQMMQAADVAHTMQSWSNFLKWNSRLYYELYDAYCNGRGDDPSTNWYKGQISFYDFYVLPLAKRLEQCNVFQDENMAFVKCAQNIRQRWIQEGEIISQKLAATTRTTRTSSGMDGKTSPTPPPPPPVVVSSSPQEPQRRRSFVAVGA